MTRETLAKILGMMTEIVEGVHKRLVQGNYTDSDACGFEALCVVVAPRAVHYNDLLNGTNIPNSTGTCVGFFARCSFSGGDDYALVVMLISTGTWQVYRLSQQESIYVVVISDSEGNYIAAGMDYVPHTTIASRPSRTMESVQA